MDYKLEKILREAEAEKISNYNVARGLDLYYVYVNGYGLVFMKSHKPFGVRCYRLDDNLAKVLGFGDIERLKGHKPKERCMDFGKSVKFGHKPKERCMDFGKSVKFAV